MLDARLKPGISRAKAEVLLNVIKKRLDDTYRKDEKRHESVTLQTAGGLIAGSATPAFTLMAVLMVVVGLVLLVACANVANILLARAAGRQKEIAIRLAMGAGRRQLIRQLLIESFLLALTGAGVGFALAAAAARAISNFQLPLPFPVVFDFNVDMRVAVFTLGLSLHHRVVLRTGSGACVPPGLTWWEHSKMARLSLARAGRSGLRNTLVIVQVALSLVLLTTAGLFLRSLGNASSIDIGFKPDNILIMTVDPKLHSYSHDKTVQFLSQLHDRVSALPGVRSVSFVGVVPLSIGATSNNFDVEATKDHAKQTVDANVNNVGSRYFETMGIPLLRGRDFVFRPTTSTWPSSTRPWHRICFPAKTRLAGSFIKARNNYTVVGMTRDSKLRTIGEKPTDAVFLLLNAAPEKANSFFGTTIVVKTFVDPAQ